MSELEEEPIHKRPLCAAHGLVAGPDGRCVVCRRPAGGAALLPEPEPSLGPQLFTWLLGLAALAGAVAFVASALGGGHAAVAARSEQGPPQGPAAASPLNRARPSPGANARDPQARVKPKQSAQILAANAQRAEAERLRLQQQATAEQDQRRRETIEADRSKRALAHARRNVAVVMYGTSWCASCKAAREYMRAHDIAYVEHDVDESASANEIMHRLNPRRSVPTIDIDGEIMVGFGESRFEQLLDSAARKRAGI